MSGNNNNNESGRNTDARLSRQAGRLAAGQASQSSLSNNFYIIMIISPASALEFLSSGLRPLSVEA